MESCLYKLLADNAELESLKNINCARVAEYSWRTAATSCTENWSIWSGKETRDGLRSTLVV